MPRRLVASQCPPGVMCLTPTLGFLLIVGITVISYLLYTLNLPSNPVVTVKRTPQQQQRPIQIYNTVESGDDRYTRAPEPLRFWRTTPDLRGAMIPPGAVPVNVPTRGLPEAFQQVGILKTGDQILPLYGRQTAYRTDRYNYYTRTDSYNPIQLPVKYERRDCMDSNGCSELLGGETIKVGGIGKDAHVEVYKYDGPQYIPGLV